MDKTGVQKINAISTVFVGLAGFVGRFATADSPGLGRTAWRSSSALGAGAGHRLAG